MITPQSRQAQDKKAPGRWFFRSLALLLCGLGLFGQAYVGIALPTSQAAPTKKAPHVGIALPKSQAASTKKAPHVGIALPTSQAAPKKAHHSAVHVQHHNIRTGLRPEIGPISISVTDSGGPYMVGHQVTFTLTVTNDGLDPITNGTPIDITDFIPTGMTSVSATGTGWNFNNSYASTSPSPIAANDTTYPLMPGLGLPSITVTGTLTSSAIPSLITTAIVYVSGNPYEETTDTIAPIEPAIDFSLAMTHSNIGCAIIGTTASFILTATNSNPSPIPAGTVGPITVTDTLPADLSSVSATGLGWTTTSISGTTLTATFVGPLFLSDVSMPPLTVSGTVSNTATTTLNNSATISVPGDTNPTNDTATDSINVCPRPDLAIVKSHTGTGPFQVGQSVGYSLNVSNVSNVGSVALGQSIIVTDTIPAGLTNVIASGTNWNVTTTSNQITATYAGPYPVAPGTNMSPINIIGTLTSSAIGNLNNTATVSTPLDNNPVNDTSSNTLTVGPGPDLTITKTHQGAGPFQVGQTASFVLSVTNLAGSGVVLPGQAIIVTDHIPAALINASAAGTNWSTNIASGILTATYTGSLPMNAGTILPDIILSGQLGNAAVPTLNNTASVFTPDDINQGNNSSTDSFTVLSLPNLAISLVHQGTGCVIDGIVAYTLSVSDAADAGPVLSGPVIVSANIPADIGGVSATASSDWNVVANGSTVTATYIGGYPIPTGTTLSPISITGSLSSPSSASLQATATVPLANDSNPDNNSTSDTITICPPDLAIVKSHQGTGPFQVGQNFSFVLSVSNGPDSGPVFKGNSIVVTDPLPDGLSGAIATGPNWNTDITNGILTATYAGTFPVVTGANLPPIVVSGLLVDAASPILSNTATVSTPGDSNPTNDSSTDLVPIVARPDLVLSLFHGDTECNSLSTVSDTLTVRNNKDGGSVLPTQPIVIQIQQPVNLTNVNLTPTVPSDWLLVHNIDQSWTATYNGSYPVVSGQTLSTLTMTGVATTYAPSISATVTTPYDTNLDNTTKTDPISICPPDLAITKTHLGAGPFQVGQSVNFILGVTDVTGSGPVLTGDPIIVTDQLPAGLVSPLPNASSDWTTNINSGVLTATYTGPLPIDPGTTLSPIQLSGQLTNDALSSLSNTATVSVPGDSNLTNNTSSDTFPVIPTPDLSLLVTNPLGCTHVGSTASYSLQVSNAANAGEVLPSGPVTVSIPIPTNLTNVTISGGWQGPTGPIDGGNTVTMTYAGDYPIEPSATLPLIIVSGTLTTPSDTIAISGTVNTPADTNESNNTGSGTITMCGPDLRITKVHQGTGPFIVGNAVNYILTVSLAADSNPILDNPITVTDLLPAGLSSVIWSGNDWTFTTNNGTLTATYTGPYPLMVNSVLPSILISGQLNTTALPILFNTATVNMPGDSNPDNNSATDQLPVQVAPDLRLHISSPTSCVRHSNKATFTFNVSNDPQAGPITTPIVLTFSIPSGLDKVSFSGSAWQWHKNGSNITAYYLGGLPVSSGQSLGVFKMTGTVTKVPNGTVGFSATVTVANDSNTTNNVSYGKLKVCSRLITGNGGTSTSGNNSSGSHSSSSSSSSHSSNSSSSSSNSGSHSTGTGSQSYPGLPSTGSDSERSNVI
jgi:uncharacterized repeat protein (TIGR01451 family)